MLGDDTVTMITQMLNLLLKITGEVYSLTESVIYPKWVEAEEEKNKNKEDKDKKDILSKEKFRDRLNVAAYITDNGIIAIANTVLAFVATAEASVSLKYNGELVLESRHTRLLAENLTDGNTPSPIIKSVQKGIKTASWITDLAGIGRSVYKNVESIKKFKEGNAKADKNPELEAL
jgi:hypothetical protein